MKGIADQLLKGFENDNFQDLFVKQFEVKRGEAQ